MRLLTRYVLAELLKVFLMALGALTLMMIIGGVVREAIIQSLPPAQVVRLIPYVLPSALRLSIPVTLLLAATNVYGRMSGANEVVAIKALGISPWSILWPAMVVAFFLSLVTVWLNDVAVSWGRAGAQRVIIESVEEIAYGMLRTQKQYSSPLFAINVRQVRGRTLEGVTLSMQGRGDTPGVTVRAEQAELTADHQEGVLRIRLRNFKAVAKDGGSMVYPDEFERTVPLTQASRAGGQIATPSWLPLRQIPVEVEKQRQTIAGMERDMAGTAAFQMLRGDFDGLAGRAWNTRTESLAQARIQLFRLLTEPHRRWSEALSCLCFVWVGAPMAIWLRNRDSLAIFFLCFLPVLIVYYPLMLYSVDGAKGGTIPPWSVWAGNGLLALCGAWLLRRVLRY